MEVLLYKLKDIENIKEISNISRKFNLKVSLIKREKTDIDYYKLEKDFGIEVYNSFDEFLNENKYKRFLFLETYGNKLIFDINPKDFDIIVLGAEDYGIPLHEIEKVENKEIVKIPTKIPGSFNVVSALVIFLSLIY